MVQANEKSGIISLNREKATGQLKANSFLTPLEAMERLMGDYYRSEISRGAYSRIMSLPTEIDIDKSTAEFKDGVLELNLPKMEGFHRRNIYID